MGAVKRFAVACVLALGLLAGAAAAPSGASAVTPCRNKVFNDWYRDGKIASTYPIGCYKDALRHIPSDAKIYSSLADDIRSALQAAIARGRGKDVPAQVGRGQAPVVETTSKTRRRSSGVPQTPAPTKQPPLGQDTQADPVAAPLADQNGGGIPTPLLVLGVLALALVALGGAGIGVRRFRRGA
jgi:hypothetical protein